MIRVELPYYSQRTAKIDMLVLHCLAFDAKQGIESFRQAEVSAHYLIDEHGKIFHLVDNEKCAWHAGKSYWQGRESLNKNSIGIELCSPTLGQRCYDKRQIYSLIRLCRCLMRRYHICSQNVVGHSDIAPTRKPDPGKSFPWQYLARHGICTWLNLKHAPLVSETDELKMLAKIGYDTTNLLAAKYAFCRHFMPQAVPEEKDIHRLLEQPYADNLLIDEAKFLDVLKAVYYQYQF